MTRRYPFTPDLTIGEMILLSELSYLTYQKQVNDPASELAERRGVSITVLRNVFSRIRAAVGQVQALKGERHTLRPNDLGRSVGAAGYLAARILAMARDPKVDQALLLKAIDYSTVQMNGWYAAGHFGAKPGNLGSEQQVPAEFASD